MAHKKNGKSKANQTTTWQQKNVKLAGKAEIAAAEAPDNGFYLGSYNPAATGNNRQIAGTYS